MSDSFLGAGARDREIAKEYPIVGKLLHTWRVAGVIAGIAAAIGGVIGAAGYRVVGPPQDIKAVQRGIARVDTSLSRRLDSLSHRVDSTNAAVRTVTDSLFVEVRVVKGDVQLAGFIQCVLVRRIASDLRPPGCDALEARQAGRPR